MLFWQAFGDRNHEGHEEREEERRNSDLFGFLPSYYYLFKSCFLAQISLVAAGGRAGSFVPFVVQETVAGPSPVICPPISGIRVHQCSSAVEKQFSVVSSRFPVCSPSSGFPLRPSAPSAVEHQSSVGSSETANRDRAPKRGTMRLGTQIGVPGPSSVLGAIPD